MREVKLQDLKSKKPPELLEFAEELDVENASTMRKQELLFAILKQLAAQDVEIIGVVFGDEDLGHDGSSRSDGAQYTRVRPVARATISNPAAAQTERPAQVARRRT